MIEVLYTLATLFGLYDVAEGSARLIAALLLILHPIHEQSLGFRLHFNRSVAGLVVVPQRPIPYHGPNPALGKKMNALQALALATAFPALALFGPWWALAGMLAFYSADTGWTHGWKEIHGLSSAAAAVLALSAALWIAQPETVETWERLVGSACAVAGLLILASPWIMAYRRVRRG